MKKIKESLGESVWQWKAMEYVLYGTVFLIPLYVGMAHWFPFSAPKALLIHITAGIMLELFGWGLLIQKSESILWRVTPVHVALGIFLFVVTNNGRAYGFDGAHGNGAFHNPAGDRNKSAGLGREAF